MEIERRMRTLTQRFVAKNPFVFKSLVIVFSVTATLLFTVEKAAAQSARLDFVLGLRSTGSAPFSGGTCESTLAASAHVSGSTYQPGEDSCSTDTVVRTRDLITFSWDYSSNAGNSTGIHIRQTLPAELEWIFLPPQCLSGSSISSDKRTVECLLADLPSGTSARVEPQARVKGNTRNGVVLSSIAKISSSPDFEFESPAVSIVVSALPRYDVEKKIASGSPMLAYGEDGSSLGWLFAYELAVFVENSGKGTEILDGTDLSLKDTITYAYGGPVNARLYTWGPSGADGSCVLVGSPAGMANDSRNLPYGSLSLPNANASNAVPNSGTIECEQGAPGDPIEIEIKGADTSLASSPTVTMAGLSLPANREYVISQLVKIWVPLSDVVAGGGALSVINTYSDFDPESISGQSNFGSQNEPMVNNRVAHPLYVLGPNGTFSKGFWKAPGTATKGTIRVTAGESILSSVSIYNKGTVTLNNVVLCEKLDNTKLTASPDYGANPAVFYQHDWITPDNPNYYSGPYTLEYAAGGIGASGDTWASVEDQRRATCDDSEGPWYTSALAVPGGFSAITKVRLKLPTFSPINQNAILVVRVKALANEVETVIPNFGSGKAQELNNGAWVHDAISPDIILIKDRPVGSLSDRLVLARATARVLKTIDSINPPAQTGVVEAGKELRFSLQPSLTGIIPLENPTSITLSDTMSAELRYVSGSASLTPDSVIVNPDSTTTLTWTISGLNVNQTLAPITYRAEVPLYVPTQTSATNCVDISSPEDSSLSDITKPCGSLERVRSSLASVNISNPSAFYINKTVLTPIVEANQQMEFNLIYKNVAGEDIENGVIIDVLPFNGDGAHLGPDGKAGTADDFARVPASSFHGSLSLEAIYGSHGESFEYTKANPVTISRDPNDPSNQPGGSTVWCKSFSDGSCPDTQGNLSAIRISTGFLPRRMEARIIRLYLDAYKNSGGDIYTNNFGARASGLALPVFSPDVTVRVIEGIIGNQVFLDSNADGVFQPDSGESGIDGVRISVFWDKNRNGRIDSGEDLVGQAFTDNNGRYEIPKLRLGVDDNNVAYLVKVEDPNHVLDSYFHTRGVKGVDFNSQDGSGYQVLLSKEKSSDDTADFGYAPYGSIGDFVWLDNNKNGLQDAGEVGLGGVDILLFDAKGNLISSTISDNNGHYEFADLLPDSYVVQFKLPKSYRFSSTGSGDELDSDAAALDGKTSVIVLRAGTGRLDIDAGLIAEAVVDKCKDKKQSNKAIAGATRVKKAVKAIRIRARTLSQRSKACKGPSMKSAVAQTLKLEASIRNLLSQTITHTEKVCSGSVCRQVSNNTVKSKLKRLARSLYIIQLNSKRTASKACASTKKNKYSNDKDKKSSVGYYNDLLRAIKALPKTRTRCS